MDKNVPETAMVFAAGFGKRMQDLTANTPKPLVEVAGEPLIEYALANLFKAGIKRAVVNTHYLAGLLENYLKNRKSLPDITISHEETILETGGGLVKALPLLGKSPFFTINSDTIVIDKKSSHLQNMANFWDPNKMDALMLLHPVDKSVGYDGQGDFELNSDGKIVKREKNSYPYVFTGVMIIKPEIFNEEDEKPFSLYKDFLHKKYITNDGTLSRVFGLVHDGDWLHVGTKSGISLAEKSLET